MPTVFTIGHSTHEATRFAELLGERGVELVADVRRYPGSRHVPWTNPGEIERALPVDYLHLQGLGGRRPPVAGSPNGFWENEGFRGYADHMAGEEFTTALGQLMELSVERRVAVMCAEGLWWRCHRRLVADALLVRGLGVCHIDPGGRTERHHVTKGAVVHGTRIVYPPVQEALDVQVPVDKPTGRPSRKGTTKQGGQEMASHSGPPMDPNTSEATAEQLDYARAQGDAYGRALTYMTDEVAHDGGEQAAGDYLVGYAVEEAEGMYEWVQGELVWRDPGEDNLHVEVAVRDAGDGRFVPGVRVLATLVDPEGNELGTHEQPLLWHPMIYHYGRNWHVPDDGEYTLRVRVDPPTFMRHDETNGRRFLEPVDVEFLNVKVERGQD